MTMMRCSLRIKHLYVPNSIVTCHTQPVFDSRIFEYVPCKYEGVLLYFMLHVIVTAAHKPGID